MSIMRAYGKEKQVMKKIVKSKIVCKLPRLLNSSQPDTQ